RFEVELRSARGHRRGAHRSQLPGSGALFIFFGKHRSALKILFCDGSGMCVFYKRLDQSTFRLPEPLDARATTVAIDERALEALLDGIDVEVPAPKRRRSITPLIVSVEKRSTRRSAVIIHAFTRWADSDSSTGTTEAAARIAALESALAEVRRERDELQ